MTAYQLIWFILICVLFVGFFVLEGFDFGVAMASGIIAKTDEEKGDMLEIIGPHWVVNETWLVTAGGALFASFPMWYASLFSGYYVILTLVLFGLIIRGVSFEFSEHAETHKARNIWYNAFTIGSFLAIFLLCMMFFSFVQGIPIDAQGNAHVGFFDVVNWLSVVGGVAGVLLSLIHGLNYTVLTTTGVLHDRALALNKKLQYVILVGEVVFALLLLFQTDFFDKKPFLTILMLVLIVAATELSAFGIFRNRPGWAIVGSGLSLAFVVMLIFIGIFPRVMIATNPAHSILIKDASSSPYVLQLMLIVACILLPIVLIYFIWSYMIFRKDKVKTN